MECVWLAQWEGHCVDQAIDQGDCGGKHWNKAQQKQKTDRPALRHILPETNGYLDHQRTEFGEKTDAEDQWFFSRWRQEK